MKLRPGYGLDGDPQLFAARSRPTHGRKTIRQRRIAPVYLATIRQTHSDDHLACIETPAFERGLHTVIIPPDAPGECIGIDRPGFLQRYERRRRLNHRIEIGIGRGQDLDLIGLVALGGFMCRLAIGLASRESW